MSKKSKDALLYAAAFTILLFIAGPIGPILGVVAAVGYVIITNPKKVEDIKKEE